MGSMVRAWHFLHQLPSDLPHLWQQPWFSLSKGWVAVSKDVIRVLHRDETRLGQGSTSQGC